MKILNLTQHVATQDQLEAGVFEPSAEDKASIKKLLTFDELPDLGEIQHRADELYRIAERYKFDAVMIAGAPYLMPALHETLLAYGMNVVYAFSKRVSIEEQQEDGTVVKKNVFKHIGFVTFPCDDTSADYYAEVDELNRLLMDE